MGADSLASTEGAAFSPASRSAVDGALSLVREAKGAAATGPPYLLLAAKCDDNVSKVSVLSVVPLVLQLWAQLTDVRSLPMS